MSAGNREFRKEYLSIKYSLLENKLKEEKSKLESEKLKLFSHLDLNLALKLSEQALKLQKLEHKMKMDHLNNL